MRKASMRRPTFQVRTAAIGAGLLLLTASCGDYERGADAEQSGDSGDSLQVFAAASLTNSFTEIGELFEAQYSADIDFNFAGSSNLVAQIEQGAPAGVFASADEVNMGRAEEAGATASEPQLFATNALVIVTPPDNPAEVESLTDLAGDDVITVICAPQVPCGAATAEVTERADVKLHPASEENAVTDVLGKVRSGEADAGLVYHTDALGAGDDVETIEFDGAADVVNNYPISALDAAPDPELAEDFIEFVLSPEAQDVLSEAGFSSP